MLIVVKLSGSWYVFHLVRSIPNKQQTQRTGRLMAVLRESPSIFSKSRKSERLPETAPPFENIQPFPKSLLPPRTFSCSRCRSSFWRHLRLESSHSPNHPEVYSFPETFAPSKIAATTALFDLRLQIATTTNLLDLRLQLRSPTSPTIRNVLDSYGLGSIFGEIPTIKLP